jgi:hypothetical protein
MRYFSDQDYHKALRKELKKESVTILDFMKALFENAQVKSDPLGSNLHKVRVARSSGGKSGGFRNVVFWKKAQWIIAVHIFSKNDKENITPEELEYFKALGKEYNKFTEKQINILLSKKYLLEYCYDN